MAARASYRSRFGSLALAALMAAVVAGCAAPPCACRKYKVGNLPPEYLAASVENVQTIDLSRLATPVPTREQIGPGDLLEVTLDTGPGGHAETAPVRVAGDGSGAIRGIGRLALSGMEPEAAERLIASAMIERGLARNPVVTVEMKRPRVNRVTVIGAVANPAVYELPRGSSTLLAALVAAGGLSGDAGASVEIRRASLAQLNPQPQGGVVQAGYQQPSPIQPVSFHVDLVEAAQGIKPVETLDDGDIVMVQRRDPQPFSVMGLVNRPGRFELPPNKDLYLLDALAMAGGAAVPMADKIHLIRHVEGQKDPILIEISIKDAKRKGEGNVRVGPGDIISIEETPTTMVFSFFRTLAPVGGFAAYQVVK